MKLHETLGPQCPTAGDYKYEWSYIANHPSKERQGKEAS